MSKAGQPAVAEWHCPEPEAKSIPALRALARPWIDEHAAERAEDVLVVLSELTTNAVLHARTPFLLRLERNSSTVRISVDDEDRQPPVLVDPAPDASRGRGLVLVDRLGASWGIEVSGNGKTVWCELTLEGTGR